jgi:hypothetical protein
MEQSVAIGADRYMMSITTNANERIYHHELTKPQIQQQLVAP